MSDIDKAFPKRRRYAVRADGAGLMAVRHLVPSMLSLTSNVVRQKGLRYFSELFLSRVRADGPDPVCMASSKRAFRIRAWCVA